MFLIRFRIAASLLCSICIAFFSSCQYGGNATDRESEFYNYNKDGDLWRVPLIYPYELISPTNSFPDGADWFLNIDSDQIVATDYNPFSDEEQFSGFEHIGIQDSVIVVEMGKRYWSLLSAAPETVLLLDVKTDSVFLFAPEYHLEAYAQKQHELGLDGIQMLEWLPLKDAFIESLKLPDNWKFSRGEQ